MNRKKSVLIVDDHPMVRALMQSLIASEAELEVCASTGSAREALQLQQQHQPDLAIVDISLDDGNGTDLIKRFLLRQPTLRILVCSAFEESVYAARVADLGAHGFISKREDPETVRRAIAGVAAGEPWFSADITQRRATRAQKVERSGVESLSNRELEVFTLVGQGVPVSKIAEQLHLSTKTIEAHRENIKRKLHLESAAELLRYAVQWTLDQS